MATHEFAGGDFDQAAYNAGRAALAETLGNGLPAFYVDADGLDVMELPGGRRFEIRWIPNAPPAANYEIVRVLKSRAA